jgi:hypothetical protein
VYAELFEFFSLYFFKMEDVQTLQQKLGREYYGVRTRGKGILQWLGHVEREYYGG